MNTIHKATIRRKQAPPNGVRKNNPDEIAVPSGGSNGMRQRSHERERQSGELDLRNAAETRILSQAIEQSPAIIIITDPHGNITYVNPKFTAVTGYSFQDVAGRNPRMLKSADSPPEEYKKLWEIIAAGGEWHGTFHSRKKSGELYWESASIAPVFDEAGEITHYLAIKEDITERKQAEAALAEERHFLKSLLENSQDCIYFKDLESRFLRYSKSQLDRFGGGAMDLTGKTDFDLFVENHARPAFEDEQAIMRTGRPLIGKVEREVTKDGRESWALTSKWPLRNQAGELAGTFGISTDITALKRAEAELERTHKELVQASRLAGMAEVATSVLHNVGNVLNSINVAATLVDERVRNSRIADVRRLAVLLEEHAQDRVAFLTSDPKGRMIPDFLGKLAQKLDSEQASVIEELSSLRRNVEHVKEIVAMQQSYARVAGVFENIDLAGLLEDTLRMNAGALVRHEVKVVRDYGVLPPICTDKHKVLQILVNLVRNAKYACDDSGRTDKQVTLRATHQDGRVRIAVIDNGIGIPAENLTRIFNHGFTTRKDGHGYGLHSGALAARELGGTLTVSSEGRDHGAVFTLELPCQPPAGKQIINDAEAPDNFSPHQGI